jgi:hypothetical protein
MREHQMKQLGKAAIALAISAAMMANVPTSVKADNSDGAALIALFGAAVVGAAIAHAASAPRHADRGREANGSCYAAKVSQRSTAGA